VKKVQESGDYSIYQKRSGRYGVQNKAKKWVNGEAKTKILLEAGLIEVSVPKPSSPEEPMEAPAGETTESEGGEESAS
jgi:hypothetical protein